MLEDIENIRNTQLKYTLRGLLFSMVGLLTLTVVHIIMNSNSIYLFGFGFILTVLVYFYIKYTKKLKLAGYALISFGYVLLVYGLISNHKYENLPEVFWMLNLTIVAFYVLGNSVGIIYLFLNTVTIIVVKVMVVNDYLIYFETAYNNDFSIIQFTISIITPIIVLAYLFSLVITTSKKNQRQLIQTNAQIIAQNDEKTLMLKEIHHRVKNNLQVITSLLRLQLYRLEDDNIIELFQESINRISTMALIHSKMYHGDSISDLNFKSYLNDLVNDIAKTYSTSCPLDINVKSTIKEIDLTNLVPFSLIVNELMTNSIKHGFVGKTNGDISLDIKLSGEEVIFIYSDNGGWKNPKHNKGFGIELITTLVEQFEGSYVIDKTNGTTYKFKLFFNYDN